MPNTQRRCLDVSKWCKKEATEVWWEFGPGFGGKFKLIKAEAEEGGYLSS